MKKTHDPNVGLSLEYHLRSLFGDSSFGHADGLVGPGSEKLWKRMCEKVVNHLSKYKDLNVTTDVSHEKELQNAIERIRDANSTDSRYSDRLMVMELVRLCLSLMGEIPDHSREKTVRGNECFLLNKVRTVHYSQSAEQKCEVVMRFLLKKVDTLPDSGGREKDRIWEIIRGYHAHFARYHKHAAFLRWFKENHYNDDVALFLQ